MTEETNTPTYPTRKAVDFVIVGSGAAGGIMAKELSTAGFSVVVLEQGPYLKAQDFTHDEWSVDYNFDLMWNQRHGHPQTFRKNENVEAVVSEFVLAYAHNVGGSSVYFSGNFINSRSGLLDFKSNNFRRFRIFR